MPKKKKQPAHKRQPRTQPVPPPPPPFDPKNPNAWLDDNNENLPPFIRSLCKSLYHENLLVRLPKEAKVCRYGMTSGGRVGVVDENDPDWTIANMPMGDQTLPVGDAEYDALVRQQDPEAQEPWAHAVAAFRRMGGYVPQAVPGTEAWQLLHLYEALTRWGAAGNRDEAARAARHYTQSANLVAVHPVVQHLMAQYPCIVKTLQARVFTKFRYDPLDQFAPGRRHDICGFVENDA
jgi:hypothetical protein